MVCLTPNLRFSAATPRNVVAVGRSPQADCWKNVEGHCGIPSAHNRWPSALTLVCLGGAALTARRRTRAGRRSEVRRRVANPDNVNSDWLGSWRSKIRLEHAWERKTLKGRGSTQKYPIDGPVAEVRLVNKAKRMTHMPPEDTRYPEIAFFGQPNAGKSSLINWFCNCDVCNTGKQKHCTRYIYHFLVNNGFFLVDMPGIGLKGTTETLVAFNKMVQKYLQFRGTCVHLLYVVEGHTPVRKVDIDGMVWLANSQVPFTVVFTKCDMQLDTPPAHVKIPFRDPIQDLTRRLDKMLDGPWNKFGMALPEMIMTSAVTELGRKEMQKLIADLRREHSPKKLAAELREREKEFLKRQALKASSQAKVEKDADGNKVLVPPAIR